MSAAEYTCAHCGETFESDWTDEEAQAEADAAFGVALVDPVVVCDDCYRMMIGTVLPAEWTALALLPPDAKEEP